MFKRFLAALAVFALMSVMIPVPQVDARPGSATWCTLWPSQFVNVDPVNGVDKAGCWGTGPGTQAYKTIQAAVDDRTAFLLGKGVTPSDFVISFDDTRSVGSESFTNMTGAPVMIRPGATSSVNTQFTLEGQHIVVENFEFNAGGVEVLESSNGIKALNNVFHTGSDLTHVGPLATGTASSYSQNTLFVVNNTFDNAEVVIDGAEGMVSVGNNVIEGGTVGSHYVNVLASSATVDVTNNTVRDGQLLQAQDSLNIVVGNNNVTGASSSDVAVELVNSNLLTFSGNTVSQVESALKMTGGLADSISNNVIDQATDAVVLDDVAAQIVNNNQITNVDRGVIVGNGSVDHVFGNTFSAVTNAALTLDNGSTANVVDSNSFDTFGKGVYATRASEVSEIRFNQFVSGAAGIVLEYDADDFDVWDSGEIGGDAQGSGSTGAAIENNTFSQLSTTGIGLAGVSVSDIFNNSFSDLQSALRAYNASGNSVAGNTLTSGSYMGTGAGFKLYNTLMTVLAGNSIGSFDTGVELSDNSRVDDVMSNVFIGQNIGLSVENAFVSNGVQNNVFNSPSVAIEVDGTDGFLVAYNSFWDSSYYVRVLSALGLGMDISSNVMSDPTGSGLPVIVTATSDVNTLDYNLYDQPSGASVLNVAGTSYDVAGAQGLGYELNAQLDSAPSYSSGGSDFTLASTSYGLNRGDASLGLSMDINGDARPVCGVPDIGAYENQDVTDADGDGLCASEEAVLGLDDNDADYDDDGLTDGEEVNTYGTNPNNADSDADGLEDGEEVNTYGTEPNEADTDGDGLNDGDEITYGADPLLADSDADGLDDGEEVHTWGSDPIVKDSDGDGLEDGEEVNTWGSHPMDTDSDDDGLSDYDEVITHGTLPDEEDSDGDNLSDYQEIVILGTDPLDADSDGDGYDDDVEIAAGSDPLDPLSDPTNAVDTDGDGLSDYVETYTHGTDPNVADTDGDGLDDGDEVNTHGTDPNDDDSDDDGLTDGEEIDTYSTDPNDDDSDADGLSDGGEVNTHGTDPNDEDSDADGLSDGDEVNTHGTDPNDEDSDADGLSDYDEVTTHSTDPNDDDSDDDGLSDGDEVNTHGTDPNDDDSDADGLSDGDEVNTYGTDPNDTDSDADGLSDYDEVTTHGTDPNVADTDGDGLSDYDEVTTYGTDPNVADSDGDGLSDYDEVTTHGTDPNDDDSDDDGLTDGEEIDTYSTDPNDDDSDADGYTDGEEVTAGSDPNDASSDPTTVVDADGDGLNAYEESLYGTSDSDPDSDDDGLLDGEEVNTYSTDPLDSDSDGDDFTDGYEVDESTDPNDAADTPDLTFTFIGYNRGVAYGKNLSSWTYLTQDYTTAYTLDIGVGDTGEFEAESDPGSYGAFAIKWDEDDYLGDVNVYYCGSDSGQWAPGASTVCTAVSDQAFSTLTEYSTLSGTYSSSDFHMWYDITPKYSYNYAVMQFELN